MAEHGDYKNISDKEIFSFGVSVSTRSRTLGSDVNNKYAVTWPDLFYRGATSHPRDTLQSVTCQQVSRDEDGCDQ